MTRGVIALLAVCVAAAPTGASELTIFEGVITDGGFYVSDDGPPFVINEPTPYTATFSYDPVLELATFQFTALIDDLDTTQVIPGNLFPGVQQNDNEALKVEHSTAMGVIVDYVRITLDKTTGLGQWQWFNSCMVCDRSFDPHAEATITGFREELGGDFDEDGEVDAADLTLWQGGFGSTSFVDHQSGDANADDVVDGADFLVWQRQVGRQSLAAGSSGVPEPGVGWLAGCAAGLLLRRRRFLRG